jgi:hypothetical protein
MTIATNPWVWVAAILTFFIFSFLYRDNPFYKFAEHLFVGTSLGYGLILVTWSSVWPDLVRPLFVSPLAQVPFGQKLLLVVPLLLGLCYFLAFVPKAQWAMRIPMGFIIGWGSGLWIPAVIQTNILKQIQGALSPAMLTRIDLLVYGTIAVIGTVCSVIYFFFSARQKGGLKLAADTGIVFLMIGFGASFGYTVMARMSLLIGRFQFLLRDWLGVIH